MPSADLGIILSAVLSIFILVTSKFVGWKFFVPLSNLIFLSSFKILTIVVEGLFARWGYATWPWTPFIVSFPVILPLRPIFIISPNLFAFDKILHRGNGAEPDTLDPHLATGHWEGSVINDIFIGLFTKGIEDKYIKETIDKIKEENEDQDFFSAIKICKKKRIGPCRDENNRPLFYKKDLGILARSGFDFETSKKVMELKKDEYQKIIKLL